MSQTVSHAYTLISSLILDPQQLALVPVRDGQEIVEVRVDASNRLITVELDASDLRRVLASCAKDWPQELAIKVTGELLANDVLAYTDLSIEEPKSGRIRPHSMRRVYRPRRTKAVTEVA